MVDFVSWWLEGRHLWTQPVWELLLAGSAEETNRGVSFGAWLRRCLEFIPPREHHRLDISTPVPSYWSLLLCLSAAILISGLLVLLQQLDCMDGWIGGGFDSAWVIGTEKCSVCLFTDFSLSCQHFSAINFPHRLPHWCFVSNSAVCGGTQIELSAGLVNDRPGFIPIPAFWW